MSFIQDFQAGLSDQHFWLMILCIFTVCVFEFVNGFHDTANAVATVIYTKTLKPYHAVVWSGFWNFLGVWTGVGVAMSIIALLPLSEMAAYPLADSIILTLAVLLSAIAWNLYTWYHGIPCSSSHTMIGALIGGGLAFYLTHGGSNVNWAAAQKIGASLLLSPAFGFSMAIALMYVLKTVVKNKTIFKSPEKAKGKPPVWIRVILITTCTLVSFFHGSNDGQKGMGLIMIILLTFLPLKYALNPDLDINADRASLNNISNLIAQKSDSQSPDYLQYTAGLVSDINNELDSLESGFVEQKTVLRKKIQLLDKNLKVLVSDPEMISKEERTTISASMHTLMGHINYSPKWAVLLISLSLGIGTMVGWKRIVVTIGEKIGKNHLTYAQGATAELVAAFTIGLSTWFKLPVSTTHVLSSGVAGTMVATNGTKNLQKSTIKNIALAWILTLPVTILLAIALYYIFRLFI